jgi:signal peptidase II
MSQDSSTFAPGPGAAPTLDTSPGATVAPPSYLFLGVIAAISLVADAVTKLWAETTLGRLTRVEPSIVLIDDVLTFTLAYNKGGAFGMLAGEDGVWRRPFFLLVSAGASLFIISLYRKIQPNQWALRWGLPLVLGGALGNFADRLAKGKVVDFVDYRAGWVESMNELIAKVNPSWHVTSHWPTFNVADICICVGVGLMVVDMFTNGGQQAQAAKRVEQTPSNG